MLTYTVIAFTTTSYVNYTVGDEAVTDLTAYGLYTSIGDAKKARAELVKVFVERLKKYYLPQVVPNPLKAEVNVTFNDLYDKELIHTRHFTFIEVKNA